jgi:hypothetical protein
MYEKRGDSAALQNVTAICRLNSRLRLGMGRVRRRF